MTNPIYWLELRTRVRDRRLWILLEAKIVILVAITSIVVASTAAWRYNYSAPSEIGISLAWASLFLQAGLMLILAPLSTAGKLSQEREQRTMAALLNTPFPRRGIVLGKLLGAWSFVAWLSVLPLPFLMCAALWGGPEPELLLGCMLINVLAAFTVCTVGLGFSGYFGSSLTSYLVGAAVIFAWLVVVPAFGGLVLSLNTHNDALTTFISYLCFYHHPIYPLILLSSMSSVPMDDGVFWRIGFCLAVWAVISVLSFMLAERGLKRELF